MIRALGFVCVVLAFWSISSAGASAQTCLHDNRETPAERTRRTDALAAVRLVNTAEASTKPYRDLPDLANAGPVVVMRSDGGQAGKVARAIQWNDDELLPGWRVHFVVTDTEYALSLRDTRDACGFTYTTDETGVIIQGYPLTKGGVTPLVPTAR